MKIYTRTGDAGQTSIVGGTRMSKDAPRIEAYGTVDELNSHLGILAADTSCPKEQHQILLRVQNILFNIGSFLAGVPDPHVDPSDVKALEDSIDSLNRMLPELHSFILPGGCPAAAQAHVARTVCRRAERRIITVVPDVNVPPIILTYINRLSDWLYTYARYTNVLAEVPEFFWQKPV